MGRVPGMGDGAEQPGVPSRVSWEPMEVSRRDGAPPSSDPWRAGGGGDRTVLAFGVGHTGSLRCFLAGLGASPQSRACVLEECPLCPSVPSALDPCVGLLPPWLPSRTLTRQDVYLLCLPATTLGPGGHPKGHWGQALAWHPGLDVWCPPSCVERWPGIAVFGAGWDSC